MRTILKVDHRYFLLRKGAAVEAILKGLDGAILLQYDWHRKREDHKNCWYVDEEEPEFGVELVSEDRIALRETKEAIEPEVLTEEESSEVLEARVRARRRRPKQLVAPSAAAIDARAEFERMRELKDADKAGQLLLGAGGAS